MAENLNNLNKSVSFEEMLLGEKPDITSDEQKAVESFLNGADDEPYFDSEEDKRQYKCSTYEIVSKIAYLIGVPRRIFDNEHTSPKPEIYDRLERDKAARIVRNLCIVRTSVERNFKNINNRMKAPSALLSVTDFIPKESLEQLSDDGIDISFKSTVKLNQNIIELNRLIGDRINNCRQLFPLWLNWQYVKNLFVMPDGLSEQGIKTAADVYFQNIKFYPYQMYINWSPADEGNILYNDKKFVKLLYKWNGEAFVDDSKVSDAGDYIKGNIYDFIKSSGKTVVVVDCENSDPYKLCAVLRNLDYSYTSKISSIILFDDIHAATAWQILESYTDIPVEHIMIDRVKQNKSLVDIKLTARTCEEFYRNSVDSFIIVSSDSDYWGLISSLPQASFLVMIEHAHCGPDLKNALESAGIFYCYIDDFYSGSAEDIKHTALIKEMYRYIEENVHLNIYDMFNSALASTRVEMTDNEKNQYINKHIKTIKTEIDGDGNLKLRLNGSFRLNRN